MKEDIYFLCQKMSGTKWEIIPEISPTHPRNIAEILQNYPRHLVEFLPNYPEISPTYCRNMAFMGPAGPGSGPGRQGPRAAFFSEATCLKKSFLSKHWLFCRKSTLFSNFNSFIKKSSGISRNRAGTVSRVPGRSTCIYHTQDELRSPSDGRVMII